MERDRYLKLYPLGVPGGPRFALEPKAPIAYSPDGLPGIALQSRQDAPRATNGAITFPSVEALTEALREAEKAHAAYEATLAFPDHDWSSWYARHMAKE